MRKQCATLNFHAFSKLFTCARAVACTAFVATQEFHLWPWGYPRQWRLRDPVLDFSWGYSTICWHCQHKKNIYPMLILVKKKKNAGMLYLLLQPTQGTTWPRISKISLQFTSNDPLSSSLVRIFNFLVNSSSCFPRTRGLSRVAPKLFRSMIIFAKKNIKIQAF